MNLADAFEDVDIVTRAEAKVRGLRFYFTGKPCKHGHLTKRSTKSKLCAGCSAMRDGHPDRMIRQKERKAALRAADPEKYRAVLRKSWAKHREKRIAESRAYYEANRDTAIACRKERYYNDRPRHLQMSKNYRQKNPEARRAIESKRRAIKLGNGGSHTGAQITRLFQTQKSRCAWCRISIKRGYHCDHIMPIILGGSDNICNIQLLCADCNIRKRAKHPIDFARMEGRLI